MGITMGKKSKKVQYLALTCQIWEHCGMSLPAAAAARFRAAATAGLATLISTTNINIKFLDWENTFPHMSHICHLFVHYELNWYGSLNVLLVNKTFYMGHIYDFFTIMNWINVGPFGNAFPHESHLWSFWPLCTELMGIFKYPAWEKFPGEQHCKNPMAL